MITWFGWLLIAWWLFGVVSLISRIGKPRKPVTFDVAIAGVLIFTALLFGVVFVGTGSAR